MGVVYLVAIMLSLGFDCSNFSASCCACVHTEYYLIDCCYPNFTEYVAPSVCVSVPRRLYN